MNKYKNIKTYTSLIALVLTGFFIGCTKYQNGFISPTMQYSVSSFTVIKGRIASSPTLVPDGSSIPLNVKWTHIYDESGKIVDDLFSTKYPIEVWTDGYNSLTDTNFASIKAKRGIRELPPIVLNPLNGSLEANSGTYNLPSGTYTMDLEVSNIAGVQDLKKAMTIILEEGKSVETAPEQGSFANGRALAGTAPVTYFYNGANNPFVVPSIVRFADSPNVFILKFTDRNGVPFNPNTGEVIKRPNTGLNPVPPFLQNLQDYAPDTYIATDSAISINYPLTPFPIASLGNGYNMYYNIKTSSVQIDSTSTWAGNTDGIYYQGASDLHYLGTYVNGKYDYSIRVPLRIQVPGSYELTVKILNVTHR